VLWVRAIIVLAGNLTDRVSILLFSLIWLVLIAGMRIAVLVWWLFIALKLYCRFMLVKCSRGNLLTDTALSLFLTISVGYIIKLRRIEKLNSNIILL
jgi:hypothetical protein